MIDFTPIAALQQVSGNEVFKIKARVIRIWRFKNNDNPADEGGIDLLLMDEKGDRIQASVRGKLISKFQNSFKEGECCILMNFKLYPNTGNFKGTPHPLKIFLTWSTHVKECEQLPNQFMRFTFVSFEELLSQVHDPKVLVDVIGEITSLNPIKEITVRNAPCKLLNLQLKNLGDSIIDCVFWENYAEEIHSYVQSFTGGPIIMACSLMRINVYNSKMTIQSSKGSTRLFINSDIAEINQYKDRIPKDIICTPPTNLLLTLPSSSQQSSNNYSSISQITISELLTSHEEMTCSIFATICALKTEIPWFYIGCPTCFKKVNRYFNPQIEEFEAGKYTCDICQKIVNSTVTRYQVHVQAMDETGTTSFLLFDKEVIQLVHKSAYEMREQQIQFNRGTAFPPELLALDGREFIFTVHKPRTTKSYNLSTYKVTKITDDLGKLLTYSRNKELAGAVGLELSNSTETNTNQIDLSVEASNTSSICISTEHPTSSTGNLQITCEETSSAVDDDSPQRLTKKQKTETIALTEEEDGQLSSTKSKANAKLGSKDCVTKQKVLACLVPKKEKK